MKQDVFCEIVAKESGILKKKTTIKLDLGGKKSAFRDLAGDPLKNNETGKALCFNSIIDALNHLSSQGWTFVNVYCQTDKDQTSTYHYLMRKKINIKPKK